jgi:hypothetical protein
MAHFHVHGPHDHEVEHAAQGTHGNHGGEDSTLPQRVALLTALLAFMGAISSWQGSVALNDAMLLKNDSILLKNQSVLKKTEASNQWNYYQAKSSKQNLAELGLSLAATKDKQEFYQKEIERYKQEKAEIKKEADVLEAESKRYDKLSEDANEKSGTLIHPHHRWELAMTTFQIAISLASITILTRKRWLFITAGASGLAGIGLGLAAWLHF